MRYLSGVVLAVLTQIALTTAAFADISVCNSFKAPVRVALAYQDDDGFHASGWWAVDPDACRSVDFSFQGSTLYYAAESDSYREGRKTMRDHWGNKKELYISNKDFSFDHANRSRRGAKATMFSSVTVSDQLQSKPIAITIRFTAGNTTISMRPKATTAALADISICNDFRARLRVALAYEDNNAIRAAGWWTVNPKACRDVNFPFQGSVLYYTAESDPYREGGKTVRDNWGNKKELYVGAKDFEFDDASRRRSGTKPAMFSLATVSDRLRSKPILITLRFTSGSTTISMKPK